MRVETIGPSTEQMGRSIAEWVKAETIKAAFDVLPREVRKGFDNEPVVITDGVVRRDPRQVKPFGKIEFVARTNVADAVMWALTELQKKSPVLTGRYASSHTVMINGAEVKGNIRSALQKVKAGDRVQIVNPQPYARKLEGGVEGDRLSYAQSQFGFGGGGSNKKYLRSLEARQGRTRSGKRRRTATYKPTLRKVVQRWGKSVYVEFKYVKLSLGVKAWALKGGGKNRSKGRRDIVYPALQFFVKPGQTVH